MSNIVQFKAIERMPIEAIFMLQGHDWMNIDTLLSIREGLSVRISRSTFTDGIDIDVTCCGSEVIATHTDTADVLYSLDEIIDYACDEPRVHFEDEDGDPVDYDHLCFIEQGGTLTMVVDREHVENNVRFISDYRG